MTHDDSLEQIRRQIRSDRSSGLSRSIVDYSSMFPGQDSLIARAYLESDEDSIAEVIEPGSHMIGPYKTLKELGRGGQGVVYLAEDTRLHRKVALKVLSGLGPVSDETLQRFRREAEVASRLEHPGICGIHEAGIIQGVSYIAMQFIDGVTLAERIAESRTTMTPGDCSSIFVHSDTDEPQPDSKPPTDTTTTRATVVAKREVGEILRVFEKAARALHAAHEAGVVHRDIKPGNIMLTPDGEAVILDFGLARSDDIDLQTLTRTGDLFGTPAYMSPEQLTGNRIRLDRRTDVYSLAASLFESLTLKRPFEAPTREALYQAIMIEQAPDVRKLSPQAPADLSVVMATALDKDRDRRYQTALEFGEELRRVRTFEPVLAKRAGSWLRVRRWTQRNPALATATAAVFLLLLTALVITLLFVGRLDDQLRNTRALALAGAAREAVDADPMLGLLLALEAESLERRSETLSPLHPALANSRLRNILSGHEAALNDACFSPDGRQVLTASDDGSAKLWQPGSSDHPIDLRHGSGTVTCCTFSPDGETLATGHEDGGARLWDRQGRLRSTLAGHSGPLTRVVFEASGKLLLTAAADGRVVLWTSTGEEVVRIEAHRGPVATAEFSPDGRRILTAMGGTEYQHDLAKTDDNSARVWALNGELLGELLGHERALAGATFAPDGETIVTASFDCSIRIWTPDGEQIQEFGTAAEQCVAVALAPDGTKIVVGSAEGKVSLWTTEGRKLWTAHHRGVLNAVAFSPGGDRILTGASDQSAKCFDLEGQVVSTFSGHGSVVHSARFSRDGTRVVTASKDETAAIWDAESTSGLSVLRGHSKAIYSARFIADDRIITASRDRTVRFWNENGRELDRLSFDHMALFAFPAPDDSETILVVLGNQTAVLWDLRAQRAVAGLEGHVAGITLGGFSPDGRHVLTSSHDGTAKIWDRRGNLVATMEGHDAGIMAGSFSPDGNRVATASLDGTVRTWDLEGRELARFDDHEAAVNHVTFSPDGRSILSGSSDGTARIRALDSGAVVVMRGHSGAIRRCAISPDGSLVATSSRDGTARLWDRTGKELSVLTGHEGIVWDVSFSPSGKHLITTSWDTTARVWHADLDALVRLARERATVRGFKASELLRYDDLLGD